MSRTFHKALKPEKVSKFKSRNEAQREKVFLQALSEVQFQDFLSTERSSRCTCEDCCNDPELVVQYAWPQRHYIQKAERRIAFINTTFDCWGR